MGAEYGRFAFSYSAAVGKLCTWRSADSAVSAGEALSQRASCGVNPARAALHAWAQYQLAARPRQPRLGWRAFS